MREYGYFRVAAAVPNVKPADVEFNTREIIELYRKGSGENVEFMVLPELCVSAYTCGDLFYQSLLLDKVEEALAEIAAETTQSDTVIAVGAPLRHESRLFNCAVVIGHGKILGIVPKTYIPNYNEFYERRWFSPATDVTSGTITVLKTEIPFSRDLIFRVNGVNVGIEICEDLWVPAPPSSTLATLGAEVIINLSATDETIGKHRYLVDLIRQQSARCRCAYVYASAGNGESSTDLVFSGNAIIAEDGALLRTSPRFRMHSLFEAADIDVERLRNDRMKFRTFSECAPDMTATYVDTQDARPKTLEETGLYREIDPHPFVPSDKTRLRERCNEILDMQAWGLARRLDATGCRRVVIGISGGLDSTLALLVAVRAFDMMKLPRKGILGVTMPGLATSERTHSNAWELMRLLDVDMMEIAINPAVAQHFSDIGQDPEKHDATYENSQARERTQILMDLSNKVGGMVVGTGDLSELALGWCTYNGDQMSMYGVNASIPKTLVKYLVSHFAMEENEETKRVLDDIVDTPISPELVPAKSDKEIAQKTEDLVGPYELHDFFIYHMLRNSFEPAKIYMLARKGFAGVYDDATIKHWMKTFYRRFFNQQFKRSAMPDGPKVGSICLSPRGDWRMPSDASSRLWLDSVERM